MNEARDYINSNHHPSPELDLVKDIAHEHQMEPNPSVRSGKKKLSKSKMRFYAFNVDLYAIIFLHKLGLYSYISFINTSFEHAPGNVKRALLGNIDQMYISTFMFTYFSYFLVSFFLGHGKTLGMTFLNLKTVSHEGSPKDLSFMESFMRTLGYTVNYLLVFTPFLINLVRKDNKGLPDFFSQTEIMTEKEFLHYEHTLKVEQAQKDARENNTQAEVIPFPSAKEMNKKLLENMPISENVQQLDLFST